MKKILVGLVLSILLCGCNNYNDDMKSLMEANEYVIVDVRSEEEYAESHIIGAINIPYDEIDQNTKLDKDKLILVYCKSGKRSSVAFQELKKLGYDVYDLGAYSQIDMPKE